MAKKSQAKPLHVGDLLVTKLEIPLLGSRIVRRERLTGLLQASGERGITLIVAPAGYGKTTLLGEWLSSIPAADYRAAWLTLDPFDNEPLRFWSYVTAALRKANPHLDFNPETMLQWGYDPQDFTRLTPLLNQIARIPQQLYLILDDYQTITAETIHRGMSYWIEHQPRNLHLILVSRVTPPLPFSRLRTHNRLVEITPGDLSFTLPETKTFLSSIMKLSVNAEQALALFASTEGWIAGLQLAALSLQGHPAQPPADAVILGDRQEILDYLTEEVLNLQDEATQDFLLKTSILSELTADLCDALLDRSDSEDLLARIERSRLFVVPLDDHQHWYRYHTLFAGALNILLQRKYPGQVPGLHDKARTWLLDHGYPDQAITHALSSGDLEVAAEIIETCAMQAIIDFDLTRLVQWISSISGDLMIQHPKLGIYYALANYFLGRVDLVEPKLQAVEDILKLRTQNRTSNEAEMALRWDIRAIRTSVACIQGNFAQGIPAATQLIEEKPKADVYVYGVMVHALAEAYDGQGNLDSAAYAYAKGCQTASANHFPFGFVHSLCGLARIHKLQGHLRLAKQAFHQALDFAIQSGLDAATIALAQTGLLEIALEQNEAETYERLARMVMGQFDQVEVSASVWIKHIYRCLPLAKYCLQVGDAIGAGLYFEKGLKSLLVSHRSTPMPPPEIIDVHARLWLGAHAHGSAKDWLKEVRELLSLEGKLSMPELEAVARIELARGQPDAAIPRLRDLEAAALASGAGDHLIQALVMQAAAYQTLGEPGQAGERIEEAMRLAGPEGLIRPFIDAGEGLKTLVGSYSTKRVEVQNKTGETAVVGFIEKLLAAFEPNLEGPARSSLRSEPEVTAIAPLQEPMSQRELEVLYLLVAGKSIKEVAETLMISVNTAKTHVKNVYRKLGVHTRKGIFQRADELGILVA
jgi:LuxR family transcriptional regulator, maltose regulon positive regulatory protein